MNYRLISRKLTFLQPAIRFVLPALLVMTMQGNVYADPRPTAALDEHFQEMKLHMTQMHKMFATGSPCKELERHMKEMMVHMEMMMQMMENMHDEKSDHKMNHE